VKHLIVTVTLNPAIDRTVSVEEFCIDKVNRVKSIQRDAGGKGLNVTKTIKALGGESQALVILGGRNGQWISDEASRLGLDLITVSVAGETRENIKIVDLVEKTYTDLNEGGPVADEALVVLLIQKINAIVKPGDYLVLSGSALPGMPEDIFKRIIDSVKANDVSVIVDVDGAYLENAIVAKPTLIKPNIDELEAFLGKTLETLDDMIVAARNLIEKGVTYVVISRGSEGLLWVDATQAIEAKGLTVEVKSTVGAGDAVVAALVTGLSQGHSPVNIVRRAVATATSVVMNEGSKTGSMTNLEELEKQVVTQTVNV
jgi:1-phosphofructokinase